MRKQVALDKAVGLARETGMNVEQSSDAVVGGNAAKKKTAC